MAPLLPLPLFASVTSKLRIFPVGPHSYLAYVHGRRWKRSARMDAVAAATMAMAAGLMTTTGGCCGSEQSAYGAP